MYITSTNACENTEAIMLFWAIFPVIFKKWTLHFITNYAFILKYIVLLNITVDKMLSMHMLKYHFNMHRNIYTEYDKVLVYFYLNSFEI